MRAVCAMGMFVGRPHAVGRKAGIGRSWMARRRAKTTVDFRGQVEGLLESDAVAYEMTPHNRTRTATQSDRFGSREVEAC